MKDRDKYQQWRDEVYSPQMQKLHLNYNEIKQRHTEAMLNELEPVQEAIDALAKENTERLGGPN